MGLRACPGSPSCAERNPKPVLCHLRLDCTVVTSPWLWVFKQNRVSSSEAWPGRAGTEERVLEGHIHVLKADLTATGGPGSACLREPYRGGDRREPCPWASETD